MRIEIKRITPETRTFYIRRGKHKRIVDMINRDQVIKWLKDYAKKYNKEHLIGSARYMLDSLLSQRVDELIKKEKV
ncbi:unnamed protein product [marine sediment metagenome]|uniref:Uncharacterized protein n=1 Tax=marine sediment metagenome TaxID=412755 RepID=X1B611_9ZZZZ